jgi:hypothetical protein
MLAPVVAWFGNAVAVLWIILFGYALWVGASEAELMLIVVALPIILFWLFGRSVLWLVRGTNRRL